MSARSYGSGGARRERLADDLTAAAAAIADARQLRPTGAAGEEVPVAFRSHPSTRDRVALPTPVGDDALTTRRSVRVGGEIGLGGLAAVLMEANRVLGFAVGDDGYTRSWRPNPSAGGRHPIDLLVDAVAVTGLRDGSWWFDPVRGELVDADIDVEPARRFVLDAVEFDTPPAAIVYLVADFTRTLSRYEHGVSLVWRDAGALCLAIQLAATASGIGACIAGTAGQVGVDPVFADVGAVVLGRYEPAG